MAEAIDRASDYFGMPELSFDLDGRSRDRILAVSFFPVITVLALVLGLYLDVFEREKLAFGYGGWQLTATFTAQIVQAIGLAVSGAVLFLAAIARWTREEGSWMFVIGVLLTLAAIVLGTAASTIYAAGEYSFDSDWRPYQWSSFAITFGSLTMGYFFVAFRGLVIDPLLDLRNGEAAGEEPDEPDEASD